MLHETLADLRIAVGLLGEQGTPRWWLSNFFGGSSEAFLGPVFSRTLALSRYHGVVLAAARVHDEHIGVGRSFHLFRLPEDIEYGIHGVLQQPPSTGRPTPSNTAAALTRLRGEAADSAGVGEGPVRVGDARSLRSPDVWRVVASHYLRAFESEARVYPYFAEAR